jgi:thiamine biosynthesis lipoprotein ApbE
MSPSRLRSVAAALAFAFAFVIALPVAGAEPVRLAGHSLGWAAEIEVRDLERDAAGAAIADAFDELERARRAARSLEQRARGGEPVALDATEAALLRRLQGLCYWSEGTLGPAGGELLRLWGAGAPAAALPTREALEPAVESARCERLTLAADPPRLELATASSLALGPFEVGWAVDRAAERLAAHGATNFWIAVGPVARAAGGGPDGRGWRFAPPRLAGQEQPLAPFHLRDQALALLTPDQRPLRIAGERFPPFVDYRRGRPAGSAVAVLVVSELAVDAAAVGYVMFARGPADGTLLLGNLTERPSIRWLLGTGGGPPLLTDVNWGVVSRR